MLPLVGEIEGGNERQMEGRKGRGRGGKADGGKERQREGGKGRGGEGKAEGGKERQGEKEKQREGSKRLVIVQVLKNCFFTLKQNTA